jgi:predicted Fe-Mo cluster-binding NifX family protein
MLMKLIVACATDDGQRFIDRHFGDARHYAIYQLDGQSRRFLRTIPNTSKKEESHADPEKAKSVIALLKDEQVQIVVAKEFGPNIGRIKQYFVPVIINVETFEAGFVKMREYIEAIAVELEKGEARSFLLLK